MQGFSKKSPWVLYSTQQTADSRDSTKESRQQHVVYGRMGPLMKTLIQMEEEADRAYPTVVWLVLNRSPCREQEAVDFYPCSYTLPNF